MIGITVSHYKILERLGEGGMGVVYKAEDTRLKRIVALKFLPPALTCDPEAKERFFHEAQAASALDHPNICAVHDIGETGEGQTYIVMACYEGETLKSRIEDGRLRIEDGIDIAIQIAEGLARAHVAGIVHRDIKPANIIVTNDGTVKIVDFGLAKLSGGTLLTRTGSTLGTVAYMSPEQARSETVDARTDIWALGVVMYEMFTGRRPFESDQESALLYSIMNVDPPRANSFNSEIPESLGQILQRAMARQPEQRYSNARDLVADLEILKAPQARRGETFASRLVRKRRNRRISLVAGLTVLLVAVLLLLLPVIQENALALNPKAIAVISFENLTGDKTQDHIRNVLQDAIITSLEQSKYLRVTTRQRMADILKQMGKKDVEYVDNEVGLDICRREGAELMAVGTFASVGNLYQTTLKLVDVKTLETTKTFTSNGKGVESLLEKQIDDLSREVAKGIGVSEKKTQEQIRPVAEISTSSLEAYQLYIRGTQEGSKGYAADALRFYEMAVQKDSLFAMPWFWLGFARDDPKAAAYAREKARSLAWRASEKDKYTMARWDTLVRTTMLGLPGLTKYEFMKLRAERFPEEKEFLTDWACALYIGLGRIDEAIAVFKRVLELDPTYIYALNNLAYAYDWKGEWEKAIETLRRFAAASPGDANPYDSMGDIYSDKLMYDQAIASYKQALAVKSDWAVSANKLMWCSFILEEYEDALRWTDSSAARDTSPGNQARQMWERAFIALWQGKINSAEHLLEKRDAILTRANQQVERGLDFLDIWIACERRQFARSRRALDSPWWRPAYERQFSKETHQTAEFFVEMCRGFIDLKAGMMDSAAIRLTRMDSIRAHITPSDSAAGSKWLIPSYQKFSHLLRSEWLMAAGQVHEALAAGRGDDPYDFASGPAHAWGWGILPSIQGNTCHQLIVPVMLDVVPRAYVALGQLDSAIAAYERALTHAGAPECPVFPRYRYRLALLYEKKGMKEKAIEQYKKFLKVWGKADPIYKEPADARRRLARLKSPGIKS